MTPEQNPAEHAAQLALIKASLLLAPKRCDRQFEARKVDKG